MSFFTTCDNVVVQPDESPDQVGTIHMPEASKKRLDRGTVVAVGSDLALLSPGPKVGDRVAWPDWAGQEVEWEGHGYVSIAWKDIKIWEPRTECGVGPESLESPAHDPQT